MKRLWKLGLACMLFLLMLSACSYQYRPTEGVWYCEKLDIYLDMDSPSKGMYLAENGSYEPLVFLIAGGAGGAAGDRRRPVHRQGAPEPPHPRCPFLHR